ncbi:MAG: hypothetical protein IJ641_10920 [Lachnospiraceae bacterium]|nr:hypothetical protein [Lachnospiraceae bacterium]
MILWVTVIYYIVFSFIHLDSEIAQEWGFIYGIPWRINSICVVIVSAYAVFTVLEEKDRRKKAFFLVLDVFSIVFGWELILLMVAMAHRSMKEWMPAALVAGLSTFGLTMLCAFTGLIDINGHNARRLAFGMVNRTNFAFAVLFFIISFSIIRGGYLKYYEYAVLFLFIIATFYHVTAKNAMVCMTLFVLLCLSGQIYDRLPGEKKGIGNCFRLMQKYFLDYAFVLSYVLYRIVVYYRKYFEKMKDTIPWIRTFIYRLNIGAETVEMPITLFGQWVRESGNSEDYYVMDSFFAKTPVRNGLVYFVLIMGIFTYFLIRARRSGQRTIYFAFLVMALYAITDPTLVNVSYNFIVALPFAAWDIKSTYGSKPVGEDHEY